YLPAVILATIVGYRGGSRSYRLGHRDIDRAVRLLAPAQACTAVEHPNLRVWRDVQQTLWDDGDPVAGFAADPPDATDDPYVHRLREVVASGRQDVPYGTPRWWPATGAPDDDPMISMWQRRWPGALPLAAELKEHFPDRWVRFHSLPG